MQKTIFSTPFTRTLLRFFALCFLRLTGWQVVGRLPQGAEKCVLIAAPHTSNWDLPYTLMVCLVLRLNIYWIGKVQIFRFPFHGLMRWLGGIAVDRSRSNHLVADLAAAVVATKGRLQLVISPEGTRKKTRHWKTGFYHIAHAAQVPIVLGYLDYERKIGGLGPLFTPTGDLQVDMRTIQAFYASIIGKNEAQFATDA